MAFLTDRFPEKITFGARGGPTWATNVVMLGGGNEQRIKNWSKARLRWDVSHGIKTQDDFDELLAFFYNAAGRANSFRFKDWTDYRVADADKVTLATYTDLSDESYQLFKTYTIGSDNYYRPITRPVASAFKLFYDGVQAVGSEYSLDADTGVLTLTGDPPNGTVVAWSGEFDVPCRFDIDEMNVSYDDYNNYNWPRIPIVEVRESFLALQV